MDLKNLTVFNMIDRNIEYLAAKQQVIAGNIANATTPGYLPKEIEKPAFEQEVGIAGMTLARTNAKHLSGVAKDKNAYHVYTPKPTQALTIDGNGVILEQQMNEASKTSSEYRRMISIYNKYKSLLRTATTKINS